MQPEDVSVLTNDIFWKEVFEAWYSFKQVSEKSSRTEDKIIWLNSQIRVQNKPVLWKDCIERGLIYISQLYQNENMISFAEANHNGEN